MTNSNNFNLNFSASKQFPSRKGRATLAGNISPLNSTFRGSEGGSVEVRVNQTPGNTEKRVVVTLNKSNAEKVAAISSERLRFGDYDVDPDGYEHDAHAALLDAVPDLMHAMAYARTVNPVQIEVCGFFAEEPVPMTPLDGIVISENVRRHIFNLVGTLAGGWNLKGIGYHSENFQKLLRAVSPVALNAGQASSQGFAADLGWHGDNANRAIPGVHDCHPGGRGPMNPFQAFVNVRSDASTPMETVALADAVSQASREHGAAIIDQLQRSEFAIDKPDSHGGGRDVENGITAHIDMGNSRHQADGIYRRSALLALLFRDDRLKPTIGDGYIAACAGQIAAGDDCGILNVQDTKSHHGLRYNSIIADIDASTIKSGNYQEWGTMIINDIHSSQLN